MRQVTSGDRLNQVPVWWPDGSRLLFISDRDGTPDIYSVPLSASSDRIGTPMRLTTGLGPLSFSISGDGRRLAYSVPAVDGDIWVISLSDEQLVSLADASRLVSRRQVIETVSLSPDGRWIAFDSNRSGNQDIFKVSVDGGEPIQLTRDLADDFAPEWSPDGTELVFYSFRNGNRDLFVMDDDGRLTEQVTDSPGSDAFPDWSPDGGAIVYQHNPNDAPGDFPTLYRVERAGEDLRSDPTGEDGRRAGWTEPQPLNREWSELPRSSPDGRWIAYRGVRKLMVLSTINGKESVVLGSVGVTGAPVWSADSETLYFAARIGETSAIWRIPRAGGEPDAVVVDGEKGWGRFWFDTDGERLVFTRFESREADIWVVDLEGSP